MRQHTKSILGAMARVTVLLLLAIAFDAWPYLRGPDEWRWSYAIPSRPARHVIPASAVATYLVVALLWCGRLIREAPGAWERRAFFLFIILAVPLIQASLYSVEDPDILEQPFYRTVSPTSGGVFSVASTINDPLDYLRRYPERMPSYPIHSRCYPPGLPVLFYGARRLLEHVPWLANAIRSRLRLCQCHNLWLTGEQTGLSSYVVALIPIIVFFTFDLLGEDELKVLHWETLILFRGGITLGEALGASGVDVLIADSLATRPDQDGRDGPSRPRADGVRDSRACSLRPLGVLAPVSSNAVLNGGAGVSWTVSGCR